MHKCLFWDEIDRNLLVAPPPEVKQEPIADYPDPPEPVVSPANCLKMPSTVQRQTEPKKGQRESMIAIRKDYSYKYNAMPQTHSTPVSSAVTYRGVLSPEIASPILVNGSSPLSVQSNREESILKRSPGILKSRDGVKRTINPLKPPISILERHNYEKGPTDPKLIKIHNKSSSSSSTSFESSESAIASSKKSPSPAHHANKSHVPISEKDVSEHNKSKQLERDRLKVIVAQNLENPIVKQEQQDPQSIKSATTMLEQKDAQNINKINNKINIIFQLNDNTKSLRKNIILHRRAPKKMVQKITIKETNNNTKMQTDDAVVVSDKVLCSVLTQTESLKANPMKTSTTSPLCDEPTEHLLFEDDILISLQKSTICFFEYNRLGSLLKKGDADFKLIDRIPRRLHDTLVESDNKYQCLCLSDQNSFPIYVEMRAKQKELDDPDMCPIAFLYCNVYYIDQRRAKFSSVHLDTVKSVISDIVYTTIPYSSYFLMAWNEKSPETKDLVTGIVKYKLTPNLDLAKLASIRQFPKLNYKTKQMSCGQGLWRSTQFSVLRLLTLLLFSFLRFAIDNIR
jgi:hypothetical protein